MKNKKFKGDLQAGFAPLLVIAIVAILAIGGGVYVASKNKQAKVNTETEVSVETEANTSLDVNTKAKGSFRSLLALGKSTQCSFTSVRDGVTSSGTVYITASGDMRGDFTTEASGGTQTSSMILKDGYSYVWSGNQGAKMNVESSASAGAGAGTNAQTQQSVDLDSQVDYDCRAWSVDQSKFTLPSGVNFLDIEAMMKGSAVPTGAGWDGTIKGKGTAQ